MNDLEKYLFSLLQSVTKRLAGSVETGPGTVPQPVLARDIAILVRVGDQYCDGAVSKALATYAHRDFCIVNGFCPLCGSQLKGKKKKTVAVFRAEGGLCPACRIKADMKNAAFTGEIENS
jgi:hypothetical protein